jgi:WD40 repeat protein
MTKDDSADVEKWHRCCRRKWSLIAILIACFEPINSQSCGEVANADVQPRVDRFGDPLPHHALARMGTVRFRHPHRIAGIRCLPDGKTLYSITPYAISQWDISSGKLIHTSEAKCNLEWSELAPNGKLLATREMDGTIQLIDSNTGKRTSSLQGHSKEVIAIAFSDDGTFLASGGEDAEIRIWDLHTRKAHMVLRGHHGTVHALQFLPDSKTLVSAGDDDTVRFWDLREGKERYDCRMTVKKVHRIRVSPNGKKVVLSTTNDSLVFINAATHRHERTISASVSNLCLSPDNSLLATSHEEECVLWRMDTGSKLRSIKIDAGLIAFSTDGKYLMIATAGSIRKFDVASGEDVNSTTGHVKDIKTTAISPDGKIVYSWSADRTLKQWELGTGKYFRTYRFGNDISCAAFSPLRTQLALGSRKGDILIVDPLKGTRLFSFPPHEKRLVDICFSHDGWLLASISTEGFIRVWDVHRRQLLHTIRHRPSPLTIAFSRNRQLLAIKNVSHSVSLIDLKTGDLHRTLPMEDRFPNIIFSSDDTALIIPRGLAKRGFAQFRDLDSGALRATVGAPGSIIHSLAFAPDDSIFATGEENGEIHLWEMITGKHIQTMRGHQGIVECISFSSDGQMLVTGGRDTTALVWDLSLLPSGVKPGVKPPHDPQPWKQWWESPADTDANKAHTAMRTMVAYSEHTISFLKPLLSPVSDQDLEPIRHLIDLLDDEDFNTRRSAANKLNQLGADVSPLLRQAFTSKLSIEARRQIETILQDAVFLRSPETIRQIRAIQILEHIGTPDARFLLERLAKGTPLAPQTVYAKAALKRMTTRLPIIRDPGTEKGDHR